MHIIPVPALSDNYIWLIRNGSGNHVVIIDPGEATPVLRILQEGNLQPLAILVTHHHPDHVNGISGLLEHYETPVYGPATERIRHLTHGLQEGDLVDLPALELTLRVCDVPGHTAGSIAYHGQHLLFSGDTLFTAGCGKLFEGTAAQMHSSLAKLAALPGDTLLYCGHEYTTKNLAFARVVEPDNIHTQHRVEKARQLRMQGLPTVPAPLTVEMQTNPFLRTHEPTVIAAASQHAGRPLADGVEVLAVLRGWKDHFSI